MSSLVRFAAMIPASCAVTSASPFGSARSFAAVVAAIDTVARAVARRRDIGLPPTSTIRTPPRSSTWDSSAISAENLSPPPLAARSWGDVVERPELPIDPRRDVVLSHVLLHRLQAIASLGLAHRERGVYRRGLRLDIERVEWQGPFRELSKRARVLGEQQHTVS